MRKRTIKNVADTIFWYVLYFLPIIILFLYMISSNTEVLWQYFVDDGMDTGTIFAVFSDGLATICSGLGLSGSNFVFLVFDDVFGPNGVVPLFSIHSGILYFFSWFVCVYLTHLCVDFLLFIPRLAHKWMNGFTGGGAE